METKNPLIEAYLPFARQHEGWHGKGIPYLYLDPPGHLTIGFGHLVLDRRYDGPDDLPTRLGAIWPYGVQSLRANKSLALQYRAGCLKQRIPGPMLPGVAEALPFLANPLTPFCYETIEAKTGTVGYPHDDLVPGPWGVSLPKPEHGDANLTAWIAEAKHVWNRPHGKHHSPRAYELHSTFRMTSRGMETLLKADALMKVSEIKRQPLFAAFDSYPLDAQLALLDLCYQGKAEWIAHWNQGKFAQAVRSGRWFEAAELCPDANHYGPEHRRQQRVKWLLKAYEKGAKPDQSRYLHKAFDAQGVA